MADVRQVNIRMDSDLADLLKAAAATAGVSLNQMIVQLLAVAVKEIPATPTLAQRVTAIERRLDELEDRLG